MADNAAAPRRSQRDRKQVKPFPSSQQSPSKRKRPNNDNDGAGGDSSLTELSDRDTDDRDDEHDFTPAKSKKRAVQPRKPKPPPPAKKSRTTTTAASKPKPRRTKPKPANGLFDATKVATDTKIAADNPLFSTSSPSHPSPSHLNLLHRHPTKPFRRSSIHRRGLSPFSLPKCRTSSGRTHQLYLACMWMQRLYRCRPSHRL